MLPPLCGSTGTPGLTPEGIVYLNRRPPNESALQGEPLSLGRRPGDDPSNSRRPNVVSAFRVCRDLFARFRIPFPFQICPAYVCGYTLPPGVTCCRRLRGSGVELLGSMGSRPRLSAAAASRLHWNPWADARGIVYLNRRPPNESALQEERLSVG